MRAIIAIYALTALFSCGQRNKDVQKQITRETLNLNFDSNILNTSPYHAQTQSEKFVRGLTFETLCNEDSSSNIFSAINISPNRLKYSFIIDTTKRFSNGVKVHSEPIKDFLNQIMSVAHENVYSVFSNIKGFKSLTNGLPEGIYFMDPSHMVIELKKPFDIISSFSKEPFYLNINGVGTGQYINTIADDDILYALERVKKVEQGVNYIQIRFIKNRREMLSEFLNGNLDVLESKYIISDSARSLNRSLNSIIDDKYDGFNVSYLKSGYIIYSSIHDMYDSLALSQLSQKPQLDSLFLFQTKTAMINDSLNYQTNISSDEILELLMANKRYYYTNSTEYSNFLPALVATEVANPESIIGISVFSVVEDKYFYTNAISGLANYESLSEQIVNIRFKPVVQF